MTHRLLLTTVLVLASLISSLGQNAIIGSGFSTSWTNPTNITYPFSASVGSSRIATFPSNGSGNRFWRMIRGWSGSGCLDGNNTEYGPPGNTDTPITTFGNVQPHGYTNGTGAWSVNDNTTGHNFIFKTENPCNSNRWTIFRVQGAVRSISSQAVTAGTVYPGQTIDFDATLDGALATGQGVYLRYSTDNFATSTVAPMALQSGNTYRASVTSVAGATYTYYYFTSGSGLTIAPADADFYTINLLNNSGSNYTKTIASAWVTSGGDTYWNVAGSWAGGQVPIAGQPVVISHNIQIVSPITVGNLTIAAGASSLSQNITLTAGSMFTVTGGTFTIGVGTIDASGIGSGFRFNGGTFAQQSGTINVGTGGLIFAGGAYSSSLCDINISASASITNNGTAITLGQSNVNFLGAGTINGTAALTLFNMTLNTGQVTVSTTPTISNSLTINGGNLDAAAQISYSSSGGITYRTNYTVFREWLATTDGTAGLGRPGTVTIENGATLTLVAENRAMASNLTIASNASLTFVSGSNLIMRGNWVNNNTAENVTYAHNENMVTFSVPSGRSINKSGTNPQVFQSVEIVGAGGLTLNSNVTIAGRFINLNSTTGFNLNGRALNLTGIDAILNPTGTFSFTGTRTTTINITGNKALTGTGSLTLGGSITVNHNSGTFTKTGSGNLTIGNSATLKLAGGSFQPSAGAVSIAGTLVMSGGTYQGTLIPTYVGSGSINYTAIGTVGNEWTATTAGAAGLGRPHNVIINADVTTTATELAMGNNFSTIGACSITMGPNPILRLGGSLSDNSSITSSLPADLTIVAGNAAAASFTCSLKPAITFKNLVINGAGSVQLLNSTVLSGNLSLIGAGGLTFNSLELSGNASQITCATGSAGLSSSLNGVLSISGTATVPASNTGTLVLGGTAVLSVLSGASLTLNGATNFTTTNTATIAGSLIVGVQPTTYPAMTVSGSVTLTHNGGAAPTATWGTTGHLVLQGVTNTAPTNLNQTFGNFTWLASGQTQDLILGSNSPTGISTNFSVSNTNGYKLFLNQSRNYTGNLVVDGGRFALNNTMSAVTVNINNVTVSHASGSGAQLLLGQDGASASLSASQLLVALSASSLPVALNNRVIDFGTTGTYTLTFKSFQQTGTTPGLLGGMHAFGANVLLRLVPGGSGNISLDKPAFIDQADGFEIAAPANILKPLAGTYDLTVSAPLVFEPGAYVENDGALVVTLVDITHSDLDGVNSGSTGIFRSTVSGRLYEPEGKITYNGSTPANLGDDFNALGIRDLTINNTAGVTLSINTTVPRNTVLNGVLHVGNNQLTFNSVSDITVNSGGGLGVADNSVLIFNKAADYTLPNNLFVNTGLGNIIQNGAGTITLNNQNLTIQGLVTMINGHLRIPATQVLYFENDGAVIAESTSSYIIGKAVMLPRAVGAGSLNMLGVNLAAGTDNLGNVTVTRITGDNGTVTINSTTGISCNWEIEADNQPVSGRSLTLSWLPTWDNGKNMNAVRFWRRITPSDPWLPMGSLSNVSAMNPRAVTFTTTHFSDWTIMDNTIVLPVTFISVNAQRQGYTSVVHVNYNTAEERNVATYTLERSADAKSWESINTLQARTGTSNKYQIVDLNSSAEQTWYYRIKSQDLDGAIGYSPIVVARPNSALQPEVALYPNPVKDVLLLNVSGSEEGTLHLIITNAEGRAVLTRNLDVLSGTNQLRLQDAELSALPAGMYMVQLALPNGMVVNRKMVK